MSKSNPAKRSLGRSVFSVGLSALFIASCGLGMDTQDRLHRGQQAFSDGEYGAAVIDAKNVLLDEPDNLTARLLLGRAAEIKFETRQDCQIRWHHLFQTCVSARWIPA